MPQITLLNTSAPRRGTSSYSSSDSPFMLGTTTDYTVKGRVGWGALDPTWNITSIKLYMNRTDGYAGKTLKVGSSADSAWGAALDFALRIYADKGTGAKSWDLTAYKDILQSYPGAWYLHFGPYSSSDPSYCEWTAGSGSSGPRLVVVYEESSLTVPGDQFTIGVQSGITVGSAGSGLTHKLSYSIGSASGALNGGAFITAGETVNWTPDAALANQITDGMAGDVTLTLETYLSGVLQSSRALTYPLNVPASFVPTISSAPVVLQNPAGDTIGVYVQGRSWAKCTVAAASVYGASIVEYRLTIGGVTYSSPTNVITTGVLAQYGVLTGTVTVVDSRGQMATYTDAATMTATVYQYFAPIVTAFSVMRCTAGGVVSNVGTYIKYVLSVAFAPINNLNTRSGTLKFKPAGGAYGSPVAMSAISAYSATVTGVIGAGSIGAAGYVVSASLTDKYSTTTVEVDLASSKIWFDLHSSGESMAIGKPAETASLFDVGIPAGFAGAVNFAAAPTVADSQVSAFLGKHAPFMKLSMPTSEAITYNASYYAWIMAFQTVERNDTGQEFNILLGGVSNRQMGFGITKSGFYRVVVTVVLSGSQSSVSLGVARLPSSYSIPTSVNYATESAVLSNATKSGYVHIPAYSSSLTEGQYTFDFYAVAGDKIWPYVVMANASKTIVSAYTWASIQRIG